MMVRNVKSIGILLAVYNGEKFLREQLESIFTQTNQDWTLYVRNDASIDSTGEIIREYCTAYPDRIIEIDRGGENRGCRNNFFRLLEVVDSDYYMFCDQDDVWLPQKVEISFREMLKAESQYPDTAILAFSDSLVCDMQLHVLADSMWKELSIDPNRFCRYNYLAVCCLASGATSIINKKVKGLLFPLADNNLMYDYWIALQVARYGKLIVIDKPLRCYRQHNDQVCGIAYGDTHTVKYKLSNWRGLLKQYREEANMLKNIGYGHPMKYYWYKIMIIISIRFPRKKR